MWAIFILLSIAPPAAKDGDCVAAIAVADESADDAGYRPPKSVKISRLEQAAQFPAGLGAGKGEVALHGLQQIQCIPHLTKHRGVASCLRHAVGQLFGGVLQPGPGVRPQLGGVVETADVAPRPLTWILIHGGFLRPPTVAGGKRLAMLIRSPRRVQASEVNKRLSRDPAARCAGGSGSFERCDDDRGGGRKSDQSAVAGTP